MIAKLYTEEMKYLLEAYDAVYIVRWMRIVQRLRLCHIEIYCHASY